MHRRYRRALARLATDVLPYLRDAEHFECNASVPIETVRRVLRELDRTP